MSTHLDQLAQHWLAAARGETTSGIVSWRQGWGELSLGRSIMGDALTLHGRTFLTGLGTHADSEIVLGGRGPIARFQAVVGIDENTHSRFLARGRVVFSVLAGGRELWRSPALGVSDAPAEIDLTLAPDINELVLRAVAEAGDTSYAHADWAGAVLTWRDGSSRVFAQVPSGPPIAFRLDGRPSGECLASWRPQVGAAVEHHGLTEQQVSWRDPASGLSCRLDLRSSRDFPAVEWTLHLRNDGPADSALIEDIQSLAAAWSAHPQAVLHGAVGSDSRIDDFLPRSWPMTSGASQKLGGAGGRSSSAWLPFCNLQIARSGIIVAVGWSGQWSVEITHRSDGRIAVQAGLEKTSLRLHPGEEIRLPSVLLLFWEGERVDAQNQLRRYILAHHAPRDLTPPLSAGHWGGMRSADHLARIDAYTTAGLHFDYYWVDAGWYGPASAFSPDEHTGVWAKHVGDWQVNPMAYPQGLRQVSDAANTAGMHFLLWFEPERAICGTPLTIEHPEWFLGERSDQAVLLFDLGNPEARAWLTSFIGDRIAEHGVQCYRQDFNMDPLAYWRTADAPDRQGIHEIRHIEGLYAFWDALLKRFPGLLIDNCASGGRRIDLETCGRSIPLWRSDWQCFPTFDAKGGQVHGMGLAQWVPLSGTGVIGASRRAGDTYNFRSALGPAMSFAAFAGEGFPITADYPYDWHRRMEADFLRARPLFLGDYYPLTAINAGSDSWAMYQMHRVDLGEGFVLAYRRPGCPYSAADVPLNALDADGIYELTDADSGTRWSQSGRELRERGLRMEMPDAPGSRLVFYARQGGAGA